MEIKQLNKIVFRLFLLVLFYQLSYQGLTASCPGKNKNSSITDSTFINKNDSVSPRLPFLTFHVGCALALPETTFQFTENTGQREAIHLQNDFLHPKNYYVPKLNVMIAIKNSYRLTSDVFFAFTKESPTLNKDIQLGSHVFDNGLPVHTHFNFFGGNLSYIQPLNKNKKYHLGLLLGLAAVHSSIKLTHYLDENYLAKRTLWFVNPIAGLDVYGFLTKKLFYRAALKFSASPINNYSYTYFTFKPYIEYHIHKNLGVGLRMDYMNMSIKEVDQKNFKGKFNMELPVVSVVAVVRFFKNR